MCDQWMGYIVRFAAHQQLPPGYTVEGVSGTDEDSPDRRVRTYFYYWCADDERDELDCVVCGPEVDTRWEAYRQAWARYNGTGGAGDADQG